MPALTSRNIHTHIYAHRLCNSFPSITRQLTQISVDTDWASYKVTQLQTLSTESVASRRLRAQSYNTVLSPIQMLITSPGCLLSI